MAPTHLIAAAVAEGDGDGGCCVVRNRSPWQLNHGSGRCIKEAGRHLWDDIFQGRLNHHKDVYCKKTAKNPDDDAAKCMVKAGKSQEMGPNGLWN